MDCIFCKIVSGELPCEKTYEDEDTMAFLDIAPVNYGHTLVIPKEHYENMEDIPEELLAKVIKTVKKAGASVKANLGSRGYNANVNNGPIAGQVVPHLHFHVIPRAEGDGLQLWPGGKYADGEAEEAKQKLELRS